MNDKTNNLVNNMDKKERFEFIYKWHNGIALADDLKKLTGDETFEFIPSAETSDYFFKNEGNEFIIVNGDGNLDVSDIDIHPMFVRASQQRISKTNKMLSKLG